MFARTALRYALEACDHRAVHRQPNFGVAFQGPYRQKNEEYGQFR